MVILRRLWRLYRPQHRLQRRRGRGGGKGAGGEEGERDGERVVAASRPVMNQVTSADTDNK